jgi:uncharacterized protein YbjT (DUF2867 family)
MMHVLIAGAGGLLGQPLIDRFIRQDCHVTALGYSLKEFTGWIHPRLTITACNVTQPAQLTGLCAGVDVVISCLGITRMRNAMTHMDVDYQGNVNLLREAEKAGVKKFAIITPIGAEAGALKKVPLLEAKYLFKNELRKSKLEWVIFRSGGFYSDLAEMGRMAEKNPLVIVGPGTYFSTPIDVGELATLMAEEVLVRKNEVIELGGPEDLSWNDICRTCFEHYGRPPRLIHVPVGLCRAILTLIKPFSPAYYAMGKLILFMSSHDLPTPHRGTLRFADYLKTHRSGSGIKLPPN